MRAGQQRTRLYVALASPLAALLLTEAIVRLCSSPGALATREEGVLIRPHSDPRLRFENAPGAVQRLTYESAFGEAPTEIEARINSQGFRGRTVSIPKTAGVFRIACVGDSHTFGHGTTEDRTWPRVFERELVREFGALSVEVMNWGVNGYDTEQEAAQIEERLSQYEPDLVLLQFFINDTAIRGLSDGPEPRYEGGSSAAAAPDWLRAFARYSRCAEFVATRLTRRAEFHRFHRDLSRLFADDHRGWARCRELLGVTRDSLQKDGVEFAVVLYPLLIEWDGEMVSHDSLAKVDEFCRQASIRCFDLEREFDNQDLDALRVHPRDFHANERANEVAGRAIARRLIETGLLQPALARARQVDTALAEPADKRITEDR